jgi:hypothetical protein
VAAHRFFFGGKIIINVKNNLSKISGNPLFFVEYAKPVGVE